jgi:hypothetical protein
VVSDEDKPAPAPVEEPVPKLPRGRGLKLSGPQIVRIFMTLFALVGVIVLAKPCASSVSNFVMGYPQGSGADKLPKPDNVGPPPPSELDQYEKLEPGMTEEELKAAVERAKAKNAAGNSGSASAGSGSPGTGSGSAAGSASTPR